MLTNPIGTSRNLPSLKVQVIPFTDSQSEVLECLAEVQGYKTSGEKISRHHERVAAVAKVVIDGTTTGLPSNQIHVQTGKSLWTGLMPRYLIPSNDNCRSINPKQQ